MGEFIIRILQSVVYVSQNIALEIENAVKGEGLRQIWLVFSDQDHLLICCIDSFDLGGDGAVPAAGFFSYGMK